MMAALAAEGAVLRAVARAHVGDGAHFHLIAAEGLADPVGTGHQPGQVVMVEADHPAAFLRGDRAAVEDALGESIDALIDGVVH